MVCKLSKVEVLVTGPIRYSTGGKMSIVLTPRFQLTVSWCVDVSLSPS